MPLGCAVTLLLMFAATPARAASPQGASPNPLAAARTIGVEVDPATDALLDPKTGWRQAQEGLVRLTGLRLVKSGADVTLRIQSPRPGQGELTLVAKGIDPFPWSFRLDPEDAARAKREGRFHLDPLSSAVVHTLTRFFGAQIFVAGMVDADPQVRFASLTVLASRQDRRATVPLIAMLEDVRPTARYTVAEALGKLKDARAVAPLIALLEREQVRYVRGPVIEALGRIGDPRALPVLLAAVEDPFPENQQCAATALGSFDDPRATAALKKMLRSKSAVVSGAAMKALGTRAVGPVQEGLADKDPATRERAASMLAHAQDKRSVGALVAALKDPVPAVREHAAIALQYIGDPRAFVPLSAHLQDPSPQVSAAAHRAALKLAPAAIAQGSPAQRVVVVDTLAGMEGQPADELLDKALFDASEEVRLAAIRARVRRESHMYPHLLAEVALEDKSPRVREAARDAALVPLARLLRDDTAIQRRSAAGQLGRLKDPRGITPLAAAARDVEPEVRLEVVRALGSIGTAAAIPPLAVLRTDSVVYVRFAVVDALRRIPDPSAVPLLASALDDPMAEVRSRVVEALRERLSGPRAVDALFRAVQDPIGGVRVSAAFALATVEDPAIVPRLVPLMANADERIRTAAGLKLRKGADAATVSRLIDFLAHADAGVRRDVSLLLGEIGDARAVPPLIERLGDRDPGVKRAAFAALGHFPNDPRAVEAMASVPREERYPR